MERDERVLVPYIDFDYANGAVKCNCGWEMTIMPHDTRDFVRGRVCEHLVMHKEAEDKGWRTAFRGGKI